MAKLHSIFNIFLAVVLSSLIACTKGSPYEGVSLTLSGVPENFMAGQSAVMTVSMHGVPETGHSSTYRWMSLNPTVVSLAYDGDRAELHALKGGRAVIIVYLEECETVTARATVDVVYEGDGTIRILAIGNSFSQDAVEQYLYELFQADGQKVIIGNMYIGGCTLERHCGNVNEDKAAYEYRKVVGGSKTNRTGVKLSEALEDEEWDYVSIQQASGVSGMMETITPYLPVVLNYVRSMSRPDVKLMWHSTWAYSTTSDHAEFPNYGKDQMTMYNAIADVSKKIMENALYSIDILVPSGTAVQNGRTSSLGDTFNRDGYHLETTFGRYTAACTWYEAISGKSVVGNSYAPPTVDSVKRDIAQNAAHNAVQCPYAVTDMSVW